MNMIRDLNRPPQIEGRVECIVVRGSPREVARTVAGTVAIAGIGLADDRLGLRGESELSARQVTLIQAEHLAVIARLVRCWKSSAPAGPVLAWRKPSARAAMPRCAAMAA